MSTLTPRCADEGVARGVVGSTNALPSKDTFPGFSSRALFPFHFWGRVPLQKQFVPLF